MSLLDGVILDGRQITNKHSCSVGGEWSPCIGMAMMNQIFFCIPKSRHLAVCPYKDGGVQDEQEFC